ncbi:hypothetical protein F5144DRAFT_603494 [Chaetomium tenue]|uniref:Uncharacterized protein n=1 Tax=Chaetomium tenue TaxID=1854479 RepID=A0ACB7PBC9_9PEZI|nr:hypothetical protein F5144DRAFT_603494 [Chaetomium globosum]
MSTTAESLPDFTPYRSIIEDLYWKQRKTLPEVIKIMKDDYGFEAKYKNHLLKWGKKKNVSEEESFAMLEIRRRRRVEENKDTEFTRFDRDIDNKNLDRFAKRHNCNMGSSNPLPQIRVATPPNIRYRTPDIHTPTNPPPSANPPYSTSTASEEQQTPAEEYLGSYRANTPQSGEMFSSWQYDDAFAGSQPSNHTGVPMQPTMNPFPRHPIPHAAPSFQQNDTGSTFPPSPYQDHTQLPPHASNIPAAGVSPWGYNPQPPQPASQLPIFAMYPSFPAFPSNYRQGIDPETIAAAPFYGESQPLGTMRVPENMPLHDTAVGNDAHLAGAMLHDSVDPSSAMPFTHTDGHTLRVEDDELDELDSMIAWPNKRARRM